jgi:hypothetical protein
LPQSLTTACQALSFGAVDQGPQLADFVVEHAPVEFDLLFTWPPAQTDTPLLSLKVRPTAHKTGRLVLHLSQFHLKLTLVAASTLGKNLEDQADSLDNLDAPDLLEIALLDGRQGVVKEHMINLLRLKALTNFGNFSSPNECRGIGASPMDSDSPAHRNARRGGQSGKFVEGTLITSNAADPDAN